MASLTIISIVCIVSISTNNGCTFKDSTSGQQLDLTALAYADLEYFQDETGWTYFYTVCRNGHQCIVHGGTDTGMFVRTNDENDCQILANWDPKVSAQFNQVDETWQIVYNNGNLC